MEVHLIVVQQTPGSLWHYLLHSRVKVPREADNGAQIHLFHQRVWPWQARPQSDTHSHILWSSFWIFTTRICNRGTQRMGRVGWTSHRKLTWQSCAHAASHAQLPLRRKGGKIYNWTKGGVTGERKQERGGSTSAHDFTASAATSTAGRQPANGVVRGIGICALFTSF